MRSVFRRLFQNENEFSPEIRNSFLSASYQKHNVARLAHLESLGLDMHAKTVFEFGAGVGDHTFYFLTKGCKVTASDSRPDLLRIIETRFGIQTMLIDIEHDLGKIKGLPHHDIFYCYGVLYHVSNPKEYILSTAGKCELFLLETCVSHDFREQDAHLVTEDMKNPTQASSGIGCRPTREWIIKTMKLVFPYVYMPTTQPDHPEFPRDWSNPMEDRNQLIRAIFIGSVKPVLSPLLTEDMVKIYA